MKMKVAINQQGWRTDAEGSRSVLCVSSEILMVMFPNSKSGNLMSWSKISDLEICGGRLQRLSNAIVFRERETIQVHWSNLRKKKNCWRFTVLTIRQTHLVIHSNLTFIVYVLRYKLWGNNKNKMKYHLYICFAILSSLRSVPYNLTCLPTTKRKNGRFYRFYTNQSEISR